MILYMAKLSEDTKRLLIALLFVLILFFIIVGCIGVIVKKIMKKQAEGADDMMYNVTSRFQIVATSERPIVAKA